MIDPREHGQAFGFDLGFESVHRFLCSKVTLNDGQSVGRHHFISHCELPSQAELLEISGIGEKKIQTYGKQILAALEDFRQGARAGGMQPQSKPVDETLQLLNAGKTLEEIAQIRGRQLSTITSAVALLVESGQVEFQAGWVSKERQSVIEAACATIGVERLKPLKDSLPPEIGYDEIKLVVGKFRREAAAKKIPA